MRFAWHRPLYIHVQQCFVYKLQTFCAKYLCDFPPRHSTILADFVYDVADNSDQPQSQLRSNLA